MSKVTVNEIKKILAVREALDGIIRPDSDTLNKLHPIAKNGKTREERRVATAEIEKMMNREAATIEAAHEVMREHGIATPQEFEKIQKQVVVRIYIEGCEDCENCPAYLNQCIIKEKYNNPIKRKYDFPEVKLDNGVLYRLSRMEDIGVWYKAMLRSYPEDVALVYSYNILTDELGWPTVAEYKGKIIQVEYSHFFDDTGEKVYGGFHSHINKRHSLWFWNNMGHIIISEFVKRGVKESHYHVMAKYPEYIGFLKKTYGAVELPHEAGAEYVPMMHSFKNALKIMPPYPKRRSLGKDWRFKSGDIEIREGMTDDLPTINNFLEKNWQGNPRKEYILELLDETYNLDLATLLMVFKGGELIEVQAVRERTPAKCATLITTRRDTLDQETQITASYGIHEWEKSVGYKEETFFLEERLIKRKGIVQDVMGNKMEEMAINGVKVMRRNYTTKKRTMLDGSKAVEFIMAL